MTCTSSTRCSPRFMAFPSMRLSSLSQQSSKPTLPLFLPPLVTASMVTLDYLFLQTIMPPWQTLLLGLIPVGLAAPSLLQLVQLPRKSKSPKMFGASWNLRFLSRYWKSPDCASCGFNWSHLSMCSTALCYRSICVQGPYHANTVLTMVNMVTQRIQELYPPPPQPPFLSPHFPILFSVQIYGTVRQHNSLAKRHFLPKWMTWCCSSTPTPTIAALVVVVDTPMIARQNNTHL